MDQNLIPERPQNHALSAFEELRAEVSSLRRAIEALTDKPIEIPDYSESLDVIGRRLEDVGKWTKAVAATPNLKLTPEGIGRDIVVAARDARANDQQMLERAAANLEAGTNRIDAIVARSKSVAEQNRELARNRWAFALAGAALWAILPLAIANSLPSSWAVPERMAARWLGTDMWNAGQIMMYRSDPDQWGRIVALERECGAPSR